MRINQFLAASSGLSRRAADAAISAGRVMVNGQAATLGQIVSGNDAVLLDHTPQTLPTAHQYLMLHKPVGYVSSHARQGNAPTLYELLPPEYARLRLVGRLDRDSSGLVLLTDDGAFIQAYSHPSSGKRKVYELDLTPTLRQSDITKLHNGVELEDGPSRVEVLSRQGVTVTVALGEGRNRQLRRTFDALGYRVNRLHRLSVGPFRLSDLKPGKWRSFTPENS